MSEAEKGRGSEQQTQPMCPPLSNHSQKPHWYTLPRQMPLYRGNGCLPALFASFRGILALPKYLCPRLLLVSPNSIAT